MSDDNKMFLWPTLSEVSFNPYLHFHWADDPQHAKGMMIILPGGAYCCRAEYEGVDIAVRFARENFNTCVLEYRVAPERFPKPQQDLIRAIKIVKKQLQAKNISSQKIAVCGFSAGGHLAASGVMLADRIPCAINDEIDQTSAAVDALVLGYPVLNSREFTHQGSMECLLGEQYSDQMLDLLCMDEQVNVNTPPTFLWHTADDEGVPVENSMLFAMALSKHQVPFALHVFSHGNHGLGLALTHPEVKVWVDMCSLWLNKTFNGQ